MAKDEGKGAVFRGLYDFRFRHCCCVRRCVCRSKGSRLFALVDDLYYRCDAEEKERRNKQHEVHADGFREAFARKRTDGGAKRSADAD